jgi:hypothetical protein
MLQRMLKMLPSWPNALRTTAEDVAYSAFLGRKSASSVRQTVFNWQSDIPSHNFWRTSRVSRPENIADFKQMPRLAPPDRIFQYQSLCCYLTHYQSFPNFCHHQIISIIADNWGKKARAISRLSICHRYEYDSFNPETSKCILKCFDDVPLRITSFCVAKYSYSNNTVANISIQTGIYKYRIQTVSDFQFCNIFFKWNLGMELKN